MLSLLLKDLNVLLSFHLLEQQTKKEKDTQRRKAEEVEEEYIQAKMKQKLLGDEAKSLFAATDKKAKEVF